MNKKELFEAVIELPVDCSGSRPKIDKLTTLELIKLLDEPETGHADEAPRYVKNILARLRELPLHDREVWLKAIMGEFEQDFSRAKWREGYEQGKVEGAWVGNQLKDADKIRQELNKPVIPQSVADWIEECKAKGIALGYALYCSKKASDKKTYGWVVKSLDNQETFARAWLDGYEVEEEPEKEKRYWVKLKAVDQYLVSAKDEKFLGFLQSKLRSKFTRKELEEVGFGWVIDCPGIELEEVE